MISHPATWRLGTCSGAEGLYGRAYGFERMMDNLGAIAGPLLALGLVAAVGVQWAIGLSVIPGLLAAAAIIYAIAHAPKAEQRQARQAPGPAAGRDRRTARGVGGRIVRPGQG
ncbi:MFS transporter [Microtetraspora malaysiensis]|uniref:MFS transporter n=1 Tax=Microtetraspora malaysiensis TaxID=161358 RepID=A0ABW6T164_9ACTN